MTDGQGHLSRRSFLAAGCSIAAWACLPRTASASRRDPRLIVVLLRGALDGLSTLAPVGDPAYANLREGIAIGLGGARPALPVDGFFALHPSLPRLAAMYADGAALIAPASATGYRGRSHFDGQDVLESGLPTPGDRRSGWLNRALGSIETGERATIRAATTSDGLGIGPTLPLILRGSAPVVGWAPPVFTKASPQVAQRVLELYAGREPLLAARLRQGLATDRLAVQEAAAAKGERRPGYMELAARSVGQMIARDDGPKVVALAFNGWDTHAAEGGATGELANKLTDLDFALDEFRLRLGEKWKSTVIAVVTEFGRTAAVNGTVGTDHGTATVTILAGGAVKGGRIVGDWPGLGARDLFEGRDLRPSVDQRAVLKSVLAEHLGVSEKVLGETVFPGTADLPPMRGLIAG